MNWNSGADLAQLPGRHRPGRDRKIHAAADGEGGGGHPDAHSADLRVHLRLHQVQQPVRRFHQQKERQHCIGVCLPAQDRPSYDRIL
jgi:hypothetical protein